MSGSLLLMALLGGFAGSFHCLGMCGGFVCGMSRAANSSKRELVLKNLGYNAGRLTSYCFIGGVLGAGGSAITVGQQSDLGSSGQLGVSATVVQQGLSIVAGLLMLVMALQLLGVRRHAPVTWGRLGGVALARMLQTLVQSRRHDAAVALGVLNGFLPCPLVLAFAAIAAATGSVAGGVLVMFAFGLGTFPAMLFMAGVGGVVPAAIRARGVRLSGVLLVLFALLTIVRGVLPITQHGHHTGSVMHDSGPVVAGH